MARGRKAQVAPARDAYTTAGAAEYLGVTPGHVRKLVSLGRLRPEATAAGDLTFTRRELGRYLRSRRAPGRPALPASGRAPAAREYMREYMREYRKRMKSPKSKKGRA